MSPLEVEGQGGPSFPPIPVICSWGRFHTCHVHNEQVIFVTMFHITSHQLKIIVSTVPLPGVCDAQGAVVRPRVPKEVEWDFSLLFYSPAWVVCGHGKVHLGWSIHFPEPFTINGCRVGPAKRGIGDGAGHKDTQTLLHCHRFLHLQLVPRIDQMKGFEMGVLSWIFQVGPSNHKGPYAREAEGSELEEEMR